MRPYVVVDASVAGAWMFSEVYSTNAQPVARAIAATRIEAVVPDRFFEEVLRICQKKMDAPPMGAGLSAIDAWDRFLEVLTLPLIYPVPSTELHEKAWNITLRHPGLTIHDALYIAAAQVWDAELWTLDDKMSKCPAAVHAKVFDLRSTTFPY